MLCHTLCSHCIVLHCGLLLETDVLLLKLTVGRNLGQHIGLHNNPTAVVGGNGSYYASQPPTYPLTPLCRLYRMDFPFFLFAVTVSFPSVGSSFLCSYSLSLLHQHHKDLQHFTLLFTHIHDLLTGGFEFECNLNAIGIA